MPLCVFCWRIHHPGQGCLLPNLTGGGGGLGWALPDAAPWLPGTGSVVQDSTAARRGAIWQRRRLERPVPRARSHRGGRLCFYRLFTQVCPRAPGLKGLVPRQPSKLMCMSPSPLYRTLWPPSPEAPVPMRRAPAGARTPHASTHAPRKRRLG
jgi:hypothetical protein